VLTGQCALVTSNQSSQLFERSRLKIPQLLCYLQLKQNKFISDQFVQMSQLTSEYFTVNQNVLIIARLGVIQGPSVLLALASVFRSALFQQFAEVFWRPCEIIS